MKLTVQELANEYGSYNLLTAYLMRTFNISEEKADEAVVSLDYAMERIWEEHYDED